jgi:2-polyprenyl-3-methyl-5-hydroxy-6-metoxy-1,4-benzoquinol methylase
MNDWVGYFQNTKTYRNIYNQCIGNRRLLELIIKNTPNGGRILELGCGTALLSLILADYGFRVKALDLSKEILDYAAGRMYLKDINLDFCQGNILNLDTQFQADYFDTICHSGVMEHFSDEDIINSLSSQAKIAQIVIFRVPSIKNKITCKHFGDERFLSNKKWLELINASGFRKASVYGDFDLPKAIYLFSPHILLVSRKLSFWCKWFSKHSIFVCEK